MDMWTERIFFLNKLLVHIIVTVYTSLKTSEIIPPPWCGFVVHGHCTYLSLIQLRKTHFYQLQMNQIFVISIQRNGYLW